MDPPGDPAEPERRRVSRQGRVVLGVVLTMIGGLALLLAPHLGNDLVRDLPYGALGLVGLFAGGLLIGVGYGLRPPRRP
ncbi:MAG: hypothetical protein L3J93_00525 [Thermoplasmata archaeon]|nr:hypothetical protein [Thermoplasmata archaeon]